MRNVLIVTAVAMLSLAQAGAQTPCPTVSNQIQVLNPTIVGAPYPVQLAIYDQASLGLAIQPAGRGNPAHYFVGVPRSLIVGHATVQYASIQPYPEAMVQTNSTCPVLSSAGTPILTSGAMPPTTVSPFVSPPCPLISNGKKLQVVGFANSPTPISLAVYDANTQYLTVKFVDGTADMFVGVPAAGVAGNNVQWNSLAGYQEAIMAQGTACPLLASP